MLLLQRRLLREEEAQLGVPADSHVNIRVKDLQPKYREALKNILSQIANDKQHAKVADPHLEKYNKADTQDAARKQDRNLQYVRQTMSFL